MSKSTFSGVNRIFDVVSIEEREEVMSGNSVDARASVGLANSLSNVFKLVRAGGALYAGLHVLAFFCLCWY